MTVENSNLPLIIHIPRRYTKDEWGGTESVILHIILKQNKFGYKSVIYTSDLLSKPGQDYIYNIPVKRFHGFYPRWGLSKKSKQQLNFRGGNYFSLSLFFSLLFAKNLKAIHLHTGGFMGAMGRLVAKIRRIPYVISIHGGYLALPQQQLQQLVAPLKGSFNWGKILEILFSTKYIYRDANAIICLSGKEQEEILKRYPKNNVICLPNGVNFDLFSKGCGYAFREKYKIPSESKIILCVAGFYEQKNQLKIVEAFHLLHQEKVSCYLVMIGVIYDQTYLDSIISKIKEYDLTDSVRIIPNLKYQDLDLVNAYTAADVFVFSSLYETFGIVIMEAWAAHTPVVCGKIGGIIDYGQDNKNLCFADISSPDSIAKKTKKILEDPDFSRQLADAGKLTAQQYSWDNIVKKINNLYQ